MRVLGVWIRPLTLPPTIRNRRKRHHSLRRAEGEDCTGEGIVFTRIGRPSFSSLYNCMAEAPQYILLDDPLAAVDMHTAQHLVVALSGPLCKGRTIILVTHHISLCLPISSFLIELFHGSVRRFGSVEELRKSGYLKEVIEREDLLPEAYKPAHVFPSALPENEPDALISTPPEREVTSPVFDEGQNKNGKLVEAEKRAEGKVSSKTYWEYVRASGVWTWLVTVFLMVIIRLITVLNQVCGFSPGWL